MSKSKISIMFLTVAVIAALVVMPTFAASTTKSLSTVFAVQNLSTTLPATVHVEYRFAKNGGGGAWTGVSAANVDFVVPAGAASNIAQYLDATMTAGQGSATLSSDGPIAAIVNQLARSPQVATSGSYSGFDSGSPSVYAPLVFKTLGSGATLVNSTLTIMNTGAAPTDFNIVYISGVTFLPVYTATVSALAVGESYYADQSVETNLAAGFYGSAVVNATTAGGTVAVVGNQFVGPNGVLTYNAFKTTDGYTSWAVPFYACRLANTYSAPITVQNVSGSDIPVGGIKIAFTPASGLGAAFTLSNTAVVPNNASFIENLRTDTNCPAATYGSAIVTAPSKVVVLVNQIQSNSDQALSYNGIRTDSTDKISLSPTVFSRLSSGFSTAITVQNLSLTAPATVTVTYTPNAACTGCQVYVRNLNIPAGASVIHNHRLPETTDGHPLVALWYGSARIVSNQPIAGVVNQLADGAGDLSMSFNAISQP